MAKDTHVVDSFENALFQHFSSDRMGDEMAHILSKITINWGKLEQALYLSIKSIDAKEADQWREEFFSTPALAQKRARARKNLQAIVATSYPKLLELFRGALDDLQHIQNRRNILSHGIWLPVETVNEYPVQPLRYDNAKMTFDPIVVVDINYLNELLDDMMEFINRIYSIGSELLAHQQLKKRGKR
jgi:hypothetical protein